MKVELDLSEEDIKKLKDTYFLLGKILNSIVMPQHDNPVNKEVSNE